MAKTEPCVAILAEDLYQVLEIWYPLLRLREAGIAVKVIGTGTKEVYGSKEGYPVSVDLAVDQARAQDFQAVIVPGGYAPDILRRYDKVVDFVRDIDKQGGVVAAICHGGWLLVSADICRDREVTCFSAIKDDLIAAGGKYVDRDVVVDRNMITSRKPDDLPRFVQEIIRFIQSN